VARVVLLVTSPRLPAGLLTAQAWDLVRAHPVRAASDGPQVDALRHAGARVVLGAPDVDALLATAAEHGAVVWLAGPAGDEDLARTLGLRLAREPGRAELELLYGSWDPSGARLLDAVQVMARLIAPDGDPWKRSQTHRSLAPYLLEEAYEAYDAILAGDSGALREELGDVLLQVVLHAGLAEAGLAETAGGDADPDAGADPDDDADVVSGAGWSIDDVAAGLVDKLIRRNPHVFGDTVVNGLDDIVANWERIKQAEKARGSALDGVALAQPALSLAAEVFARLERAGLDVPLPPVAAAQAGAVAAAQAGAVGGGSEAMGGGSEAAGGAADAAHAAAAAGDEAALGAALLGLVAAAQRRGLDAEAALRVATLAYMERARAAGPGP
jgi:XTP/dITP diphosphohydrolase